MPRSALQAYNRHAGIADKALKDALFIVGITVLQTSERPNAKDVAILSHHGGSFLDVLRSTAVHDHAIARLQRPRIAAGVQHHRIHTQERGRLLRAHASTERGIHEE